MRIRKNVLMTDTSHNTGREADDIRIGWGFRIILGICAVALITSSIFWVITDDPTTALCARSATAIFAVLFVLMLIAAKGEVKTNKMLRDARIEPEKEKTN